MKIYKYCYLATVFTVLVLLLASCKKPDIESQPAPGEIGTIKTYLDNNFDLSLFASAVQKVGLTDSLNNPANAFTIWAPVNTALNTAGIYNPADFDKWGMDSLRYFVRTHILKGKLFYQNIPVASDNRYKNLNGVDLYVSNKGSNFSVPLIVNGAVVKANGQLGSGTGLTLGTTQLNGVIYPLNTVIKCFRGTVQDFLSSRADLSVLTSGLKKFNLWDKMSGVGPFTVLAPQDSAFARFGLTQNAVSQINTAQYSPVLFGAYFVSPNHVYVMDVFQLVQGSNYYPLNTSVADYKVIMNAVTNAANYNSAQLVAGKVTLINIEKRLGPLDGKHAYNYGSIFLGEQLPDGAAVNLRSNLPKGRYIDFTCTNGVVHLLSQILVMPSEVKIN